MLLHPLAPGGEALAAQRSVGRSHDCCDIHSACLPQVTSDSSQSVSSNKFELTRMLRAVERIAHHELTQF